MPPKLSHNDRVRLDALEAKAAEHRARNVESLRQRFDANETAILARKLEYVSAEAVRTQYPELMLRNFFPVTTNVPTGAESYTYEQYDETGSAAIVSNYASDFPRVEMSVSSVTQKIVSLGDSYSFSMQDIRAAMMAGTQLEAAKSQIARRAIWRKEEDLACLGSTEHGIQGLLDHSAIPATTAAGAWTAATPDAIASDVAALTSNMRDVTADIYSPDTLLLPSTRYSVIAQRRMGTDGSSMTILAWLLANNPWIKRIIPWRKLNTAGAGGTPRALAFASGSSIAEILVSQEYEETPAQLNGMAYTIFGHERCGGMVIRQPLALRKLNGL